jgi:hypothetical protein
MRPRANDRHFAQQYIHQLGELVDIRAPQNTANARYRARLQGDQGRRHIGRICPSVECWRISWPGVSTFSNQYEYGGSSWGGVMFGLENKDLTL